MTKNLLEFPSTGPKAGETPSGAESKTLSPAAVEKVTAVSEEAVAESIAVGHALAAVWQTPWMADVCIREADGMGYRCRIALQLDSGPWLELTPSRLVPLDPAQTGEDPSMGWQRVRPAEHQWNEESGGFPLGQTVAALGLHAEGIFHVVLEGGLLWIDQSRGGICRFEPLDASRPETRTRLSRLTRPSTGEPLISADQLNIPGR